LAHLSEAQIASGAGSVALPDLRLPDRDGGDAAAEGRLMFEPKSHDHAHCIEDAIDRAELVCGARGARLTDIRRHVLELIWKRHEPVGAYDLLDELRATHRRAAPPTVYRALDFLMENGLVHRIESLERLCRLPASGTDA
jgi:hypothetical protein